MRREHRGPVSLSRALASATAASVFAYVTSCGAVRAQTAASADCTLLSRNEIANVLGYPASDADEVSRENGSCFFYSRSASEDGTLAYRIVRAADMDALRRTFAAAKITCGGVAPQAPRYAECATYAKLAAVPDPKAYCEARADQPDAAPLDGGPAGASYASGSLFLMRGADCYEARVLHGDEPQPEAEAALLRLLLARSRADPGHAE